MSADFRGRATGAAGGASLTPGQHLRAELRRLGLDQVAAGRALGLTRQTINNIVNDRFPIARATASKLGELTGHRADYWLQSAFPTDHSAAPVRSRPSVAEPGGHVLVNQQILRALQQGVIRIEPFAESQLRSASIDFTLDRQAMTLSGESIDLGGKHGFRLESGRAVKVYTRERIELPPNYLGRAGAAERLAVSGVVAMHALQIDPGFRGRLHFCLFNASEREFPMRPGDPVLCVEIMPLAVAPAASRVGKHLSTRRRRAK
jgi:deoxycytidine triphosphate deaminase/plasmid maintenance system antidote protein VapI